MLAEELDTVPPRMLDFLGGLIQDCIDTDREGFVALIDNDYENNMFQKAMFSLGVGWAFSADEYQDGYSYSILASPHKINALGIAYWHEHQSWAGTDKILGYCYEES